MLRCKQILNQGAPIDSAMPTLSKGKSFTTHSHPNLISALAPHGAPAEALDTCTHLLQSVYKQFPTVFCEMNHNPLRLPVCPHKHGKLHEATGVSNPLDPLGTPEKQTKCPAGQKRKEKINHFEVRGILKKLFLNSFSYCVLN